MCTVLRSCVIAAVAGFFLAGCSQSAGQANLKTALAGSKSCEAQKKQLDAMHARGQSGTTKYHDLIDDYLSRCL